MSFVWAGSAERDDSFEGIYKLYEANSLNSTLAAFHMLNNPPLAITFATIDNNIGYFGSGRHPIRENIQSGSFL